MSLDPVIALEIGTSQVRALVGEDREDGSIMITSLGETPSRGVRKGQVVDFDNALACVRHVLERAEKDGNLQVELVHLLVTGGHIQSQANVGQTVIQDASGEIQEEDVEQACELARAIRLPAQHERLHSIVQHYLVDDRRVDNPIGLEGARLSVSSLIISMRELYVRNAVRVVHSARVEVDDLAFSGLCAAQAVLTPAQKQNGVLVLDLGGGTTDYLAYANREIAAAGCLDLGGDHLTNDLAQGLNLPTAQAERLKQAEGCVWPPEGPNDRLLSLPADGSFAGRTVRTSDIHLILHARMSELLELVRDEIESKDLAAHFGAGVVLTGGGAQLRGVCELVTDVFRLPCCLGRPRGFSGLALVTDGPSYAAPLGLVRFAIQAQRREARPATWWGKLRDMVGRGGGAS
ncbi:MAG: cell division protein FtsA [Candidatus Marinimicrobia bacterium]|nr:cell division protein FtsA [Candidatus Neomarinimicrobiota bacterium]